METWESVMERMRAQIARLDPEWTDYNPHDPGITLLELFVWLNQAQKYHASRIGPHHLKKYIGLLGIDPIKQRPGHTLITVEAPGEYYLEEGTCFYAGNICFETRESQMVADRAFLGFHTIEGRERKILAGEWLIQGKGVSIWPFGKNPKAENIFLVEMAVPLTGRGMYRLFLECACGSLPGYHPVEEDAYDGHGFYPLAAMELEYQTGEGRQKALVIRDETYGMMQSGSICFSLPVPMSETAPYLRFTLIRSDYLLAPNICRISLGMVEAWQQETGEHAGEWIGNGMPEQQYEMEDSRVEEDCLLLQVEDELCQGEMTEWERVEDFDRSGPESCHYLLEHGILKFGDGFRGKMPEGKIWVKRLVCTLGEEGNIKAGAITSLKEAPKIPVTNERDVIGGTDRETAQETLLRYQNQKERRQRAVTLEDYEELVLGIPGLLIEDCHVYTVDPAARELMIAVKPYTAGGYGCLNHAYEKNLYRYLEEKRLLGTRLILQSPEYIDLEITCVIEAKVQYLDAGQRAEREITVWMAQKKFGEGIRYGELRGLIDTLPYVRRIEALWINMGSKGKRNHLGDILISPNGLFRLRRVVCSLMESGKERG